MIVKPVRSPAEPPPWLSAVVLAAGAGRRFGGAKLTASWRDGVLLDGALAAAFAAPVKEVIVVTGCDDAVASAAHGYAVSRGEEERLRMVSAPDWSEGLAASLRSGLAAVPAEAFAAFIFLGDMPIVPHDLASRLAQALDPGVEAVQPTVGGRPAHPVLLTRSLFIAAQTLTGDHGAQVLLRGASVVRLEVGDPSAVFDVDTPEILDALAGGPD